MNPTVRRIVRALVLMVNTPLAKIRTRRALRRAGRPLRLEIGGLAPRAGWIVTNVNAVTRLYMDATRRWPLEDGSLSFVYSDNVIEHLTLAQTRAMLTEAHRCLQPGGVVRLVTPDVRAHVDLYLAGRESVDDHVAQFYRSKGLVVEHPIDLVRVPIGAFGHHLGYVFDFDTLRAELEAAGFVDVVQTPTGHSDHADLNGLDIRTDEGGVQLSVEGRRPE